ncbi:phage tail protein [Burkholderia dolosa]|uniref:phage tail protein n=1 Tax=Burkholderia dolosa TaxID=152500 RepID=UPI001B9187CB|nr:phage tail protein [Burkholderia dolosa]MBR8458694.1 phage tail protein [Burkholderia dolosa]MDN7422874.1 phage tail protein [Burkholderia dolosa]
MSAPENSNSKTPPSLLSDTKPAGEGGPQQSRILANLEGRVTPPAEPPRRSLKAPIAAVVALVVAVGGWGAWRWQQQSGEQAAVAAAAPAQQPQKAEPASGVAAQSAQNTASAAQPATIVNDDSASQTVASAASTPAADDSRLSRALANGADDASGVATSAAATAGAAATATAAAATAKTAKADTAKNAKIAARGKTDTKAEARKHHKEQQAELAQAKKRRDATTRTASAKSSVKDDPDADLLAALVARTKPADKQAAAAPKAQPVSAKTAATGGSLASRVKECSERGFFEDQLCRWRVCDGHWGKDPACPTASQPENRQ